MSKNVVEISNLTVSASGHARKPLVQGLSLSIAAGECVGLVGESGSGKSVTSRTLIGLTDESLSVSADRFSLFGNDFLQASERQWRDIRGRRIGYVLQDALGSLDPLKPIASEVREALDAHRIGPRSRRHALALRALENAGFPEPELRARQRSFELSGGLRQRALIASAIVASPELLIADEPTTALDVTVQATILALLADLKRSGMAALLVSHDLAVVSQLAEHILVMREGVVVESGPTAEVLASPRHEYTRMLLSALPANAPRGSRLSSQPRPSLAGFRLTDGAKTTRSDTDIVLSVEDVSKSFALPDGSRSEVVRNVSFELRRGDTLGLVGGSGSGKSTTAKLCMGLSAPDRGDIRLFGNSWSGLSEDRRTPLRRDVQLISQDPLGAFDPRYDVWQLLREALVIGGLEKDAQRRRAEELLEAVGLPHATLDRMPRQLSGGQRQRVAIARALATSPKILICDEPVSALDVSVQAQVLDLLGDLQRELGLSVLFISHDLGVVRHFCRKVMIMHQGEIVEQGEAEATFAHPIHPYTRRLVASIPVLKTTAAPTQPTAVFA